MQPVGVSGTLWGISNGASRGTGRRVGLFGFFFKDTATPEIYTLSLHDALPIFGTQGAGRPSARPRRAGRRSPRAREPLPIRSEERFSRNAETDIVCRLLLA